MKWSHARTLATGVALAVAGLPTTVVVAQEADTGVPYWVSTRKDTANMRVGPGREYRINWTYTRKGVPMKVLRVMGGWRLVEDPDGARGWMLAQFLSRDHTGIVKGSITALRENKDGTGRLLWRVAPGVMGKIGDCKAGWCGFDVDGRKGYVKASAVWGADKP
jgi:SH3-like domain-containing protein